MINKNKHWTIILFIVFISNSFYSQTLSYNLNKSTGAITSIQNHILKYSKGFIYDADFESRDSESVVADLKVSFYNNSNGKGKLITSWDNNKEYFDIESCIQKRYTDDNTIYWLFKCINANGIAQNFYLNFPSDNTYDKFWFPAKDNKRYYFHN